MLILYKLILEESLIKLQANAQLAELTMLLPWLDMDMIMPLAKIIGLLRTHGEKAGVKMDTSESKEEAVPAV